MKKKKPLLYDLPEVLFRQFLKWLGIVQIKSLIFVCQNGNKLPGKYALLSRKPASLLFVDFQKLGQNRTKLFILANPLKISIEDEVKESDVEEFACFIAQENWTIGSGNHRDINIQLNTVVSNSGIIHINDPSIRVACLYLLDMIKMSDEIYQDYKKYEWVTDYCQKGETIIPLKVRGRTILKV